MKLTIAFMIIILSHFALAQSAADVMPSKEETQAAAPVVNPSTGISQMLTADMQPCSGEQCKSHHEGTINNAPTLGDASQGRYSATTYVPGSRGGTTGTSDNAQ